MGQRRGALGRALRRGHVAVDVLDPPLAHPGLHELQRAGDAGEQVVEVVGDAARELPDRLHLLRLAQLLLQARLLLGGRLLGGDVPSDADEPAAARLGRQLPGDPAPSAVRRLDPVLELHRPARGAHVEQRLHHDGEVVRVHDLGVGAGQQGLLVVAEQDRPGRAHPQEAALVVGADQQVLAQVPEAVALGGQPGLCVALGGDVLHENVEAVDLAAGVPARLVADVGDAPPPVGPRPGQVEADRRPGERPLHMRKPRPEALLVDEVMDPSADDLVRRAAEPVAVGGVREAVGQRPVDEGHQQGQRVGDEPQLGLARAPGLLGPDAGGLVPGDLQEAARTPLRIRRQRVDRPVQEDAPAIFGDVPALVGGAAAARRRGELAQVDAPLAVLGREGDGGGLPDRLPGRPAEDRLRTGRPARDDAVDVGGEDDVVPGALDDEAQLLLALAQARLGEPAVMHVLDDAVPSDDRARLVPTRVGAGPLPAVPARGRDADAVVDVDRLARCQAGREDRLRRRQVVRVQCLGPARAVRLAWRLPGQLQPAVRVGRDVALRIAGPGHLRVELDRLAEVLLALAQRPVAQHARGGLVGEDEQAGDAAFRVEDAGVGEREPGIGRAAVGAEFPRQVVEAAAAAREGVVDDGLGLVPGVGPDHVEALAHGPGEPRPEQRRVGVVEEEVEIGPPGQEHRFRRVQHQAERRAELRRPGPGPAERVPRPVPPLDQAGGLAAARQEACGVAHRASPCRGRPAPRLAGAAGIPLGSGVTVTGS
ncbi:hypothetical protein AU375_04781 [Methylobacterium radiotolerans]|nr:hypothetical protein AU375_04781 [Methylobacterium radiotolerans]